MAEHDKTCDEIQKGFELTVVNLLRVVRIGADGMEKAEAGLRMGKRLKPEVRSKLFKRLQAARREAEATLQFFKNADLNPKILAFYQRTIQYEQALTQIAGLEDCEAAVEIAKSILPQQDNIITGGN